MKIIADENIPLVKNAFETLGTIATFPGRSIERKILTDADVLLVRSITQVNRKMLEGTPVKFVATATIGTDHIDREYLDAEGIGFSDAAGSNANSVAEYVMTALLHFAHHNGHRLEGKTLGVVGVGNIGSKVVRMAEGLGMCVLQNDPPLARQTGDPRFAALNDLMPADFITLHVPLNRAGQDATYHLFDSDRIMKMKSGSVLINSSRGPVVDNSALLRMLKNGHLNSAILDVWENEPRINIDLLKSVYLGTPHIAGYSYDGKVNGTRMIYEAACRHFNIIPEFDFSGLMPSISEPVIQCRPQQTDDESVLYEMLQKVYSIENDAKKLKEIVQYPANEQGEYFDRLRKKYPVRREFFNSKIKLSRDLTKLMKKFAALGFGIINC